MSLVQPPAPERRASPSLELGTNNPFRSRLSALPPPSPVSATDRFSFASSGRERPQSRNPFLDVFDDDGDFDFQAKSTHRASSFGASFTPKPQLSGSAVELFENLTLSGPSSPSMNRPPPPAPPPSGSKSRPTPSHRKSRSGYEEPPPLISVNSFPSEGSRPSAPQAARRLPSAPGRSIAPSGNRPRDTRQRPRRNSDSSVVDFHESETKERSRRERRPKDGKLRVENGSKSRRDTSSDRRKKHSALDVIDKLDVTGIYGSGLFHHDGPFDACNPHRNKSSRRLAPVRAFPADSANNSMSGFGPVNVKADHSHIFGREAEAFNDYTNATRPTASRTISFDPKAAIETVHGDESLGLGTSTFLDGAPAARSAVRKAAAESQDERPRSASDGGFGGGIQRKRSLAQKIRSISQNKPGYNADGPRRRPPPPPGGYRSPSEGRSPTSPTDGMEDPFFKDYDDAYDRKGESITVAETEKRVRTPGSPIKPHPGPIKAGSDDANTNNGLLKRVRSLSKTKRRE